MWSPVVHSTLNECRPVPRTRSKHASCFAPQRKAVYLLGGRCSTIPLRDFWIFDLDSGLWTSLLARGTPVNLQEHTMIYWNDSLYVFGGVFAQAGECPLWIYQIEGSVWEQWQCPKGHSAPQSRKAHTAATHGDFMFIYGGYQDMRGSLSELWQFSFRNNEWKMLHGNEAKKASEIIPPPRHRHSCVIFDQGMWIYGGMTDLQDRSDFWRLDLVSKCWSPIKCKFGPGPLHSHSAVCLHSYMLIIGGEKQGNLSDEVWRFHFSTETWERIETCDPKPTARTQLTAVTLNFPLFLDKKSEQEQENRHQKQLTTGSQYVGSNCDSGLTKLRNTANYINKSRPLFGRTRGYQLVDTDEVVDSNRLAPPWLTKSSTYSLLSNASSDSFAVDQDLSVQEDNVPGVTNVCRPVQVRSESAHNFSASVRYTVPRSQTTVRLNPFIRSETLDVTTSDYASEVDDSFTGSVIGIPNPLYNESSTDREEEHRNFAQALNSSLTSGDHRRQLRNGLISQMVRLQAVVVEEQLQGSPFDNIIHPEDKLVDPPSLEEDCWSILTFGGREAGHVTAFDRPLSIWMLRFDSKRKEYNAC